MNARWRSYLVGLGARFSDAGVVDFGAGAEERASLEDGDGIASDLSHLGALGVTGADARRFLQAQLTSDVAHLAPERAQPSAWLNPKGRVIATLLLLPRPGDGGFDALLARDLAGPALERLGKFVFRAKVALAGDSPDAVRIGLAGPRAGEVVTAGFGCGELETWACVRAAGIVACRLPGAARYLVQAEAERGLDLFEQARRVLRPAGAEAWRLGAIRAGVACIGPATSERYLPQMLGLERRGAVSFEKGCYPGQEIVARTQHLGRLKRGLFHVRGSGAPPPPTAPLVAEGDGTSLGELVAAARGAAESGWEGLAVMSLEPLAAARPPRVRATAADGPVVSVDAAA